MYTIHNEQIPPQPPVSFFFSMLKNTDEDGFKMIIFF